ncbi:DUF2339 domain-containing protein [Saccharospirillum salsuginis]|uniref:Membrane protein n=1 Tax=Saccharospirillum salsuginis TaxID=418750 RepID=A0A918KST3_9GAMM|nr:DUF2339 domain-containing protein [Saccharospirillum salsuginis]GGX72018.1 membrane protein [Saccharospirillum salsuginis]
MISTFLIILFIGFLFLFSRVNALQKQVDSLAKQLAARSRAHDSDAENTAEQASATAPEPPAIERPEDGAAREHRHPAGYEALQPEYSNADQTAHQASASTATPASADETPAVPDDPWSSAPTRDENSEPDVFDKLVAAVKGYFTEGNLIVRVGIVVLFFGVAFLLQYANEQGVLPVRLKLFGVGALGAALVGLGWWLRLKRPLYALIMQGGGLGILYMTVFAALRLFQMLSPTATFALLVVMVVASAALAVLQNAPALAIMAVTGGFLAPILASTGEGSHIALFGYYAVLNLGIFIMAWFKAWRVLNLVGFAFTFVIGTLWGVLQYVPEQFASTESFLVLFFLFYVGIALLFALRQPPRLKGYVDGTLVFGVPLVAFGLQACLVVDFEYGLAWSSLALGAFYGALTVLCRRWGGGSLRVLSEAFLALGVVFASLTVPFALDGEWIATAWALEGAALVWIGVRQQRRLGVAFAILLQLGAGLAFLEAWGMRFGDWAVLNATFISALLVALAGGFSSYYLHRHDWEAETWGRMTRRLMLVWALVWWLGNGLMEIEAYVPTRFEWLTTLVFLAASAGVLGWLEGRLRWSSLRLTVVGQAGALLLVAMGALTMADHPFEDANLPGWAVFYGVYLALLKQRDNRKHDDLETVLPALHALGVWVLVLLLTQEAQWWVAHWTEPMSAWTLVALIVPTLAAMGWVQLASTWPIRSRPLLYRVQIPAPMAGLSVLWFLGVSAEPSLALGGYLPLLNPLDAVQAGVLAMLWLWCRGLSEEEHLGITANRYRAALSALAFIGLNAAVLRCLHHWTGMAFEPEAILASARAQATLSIVWTLVGLGVMVVATRRGWRVVWLVAATLLGVVVAKLFLFDMRDSNTLAAIVSFIAVGLLLLLIGYLSPIPPRPASQRPAS